VALNRLFVLICLELIQGKVELELIQPHMAQKPVLRSEVGCACVAREVSVERGGMAKSVCTCFREKRLFQWSALKSLLTNPFLNRFA